MNLKWMKSVTRVFKKSKNQIIKHAPQIMAVAGASCFVAATYCAVKETPKAMEKLEEKKALDPDMSTLQKVAVVAPEYKKTICFTLAGVGFTAGAWKIEATRMAEMVGIASTALRDKEELKEVLKEQVGEEKAQEIIDKADEAKGIHYVKEGTDADLNPPEDKKMMLFRIDYTGKCFWHRLDKVKEALSYCRAQLRANCDLNMIDVYEELGIGPCQIEGGWHISELHNEADVCDEFSWEFRPFEDDFGRLGWNIIFTKIPEELPF